MAFGVRTGDPKNMHAYAMTLLCIMRCHQALFSWHHTRTHTMHTWAGVRVCAGRNGSEIADGHVHNGQTKTKHVALER